MKQNSTKLPSKIWPLTIKTKRLILRPYVAADFSAWVDAFHSRLPAQHEFDDGPKPLSELNMVRFNRILKMHRERALADTGYVWAVFDKKTAKILGWVDLYVFMRGDAQSANFGYCLHNQHWGHGYGREAAHALAQASFRHLKLHRLEATIAPKNRASIKLIRALGFKKEGIRKKADWRNGKWQDELVYYATPDDFALPMKAPKIQRA